MTDSTAPTPGTKRFIGIDWNIGALKSSSPRYWAFMSLLGTFLALGAVGWSMLVGHGGSVVAMRDSYPWGLWFINYMFYVGLSAGGLVVYASVHLFAAEVYRPLSRLAVLQAGVLVLMALLSIFTDMERPWRMLWFMLTPNPTAPFVYTGSAAGAYMVLCFVDLWVMITGKGGERLAFRMTLIALPFAIYLHTTTAFVLALNKSRELWNSAVMVPIFLTSATASGIALLFIFAYIVQATTNLRFKPEMFRSLATLMATVIIIDLFLLVVELLTVFWPTSAKPGHTASLSEFLTGSYAWAFLPVLVLGITAFALISRRSTRHLPAVQLAAAAMYLTAVFFKRYSLMAMGFAHSTLGQKADGVYVPSLVELLIAGGILALGLIMVAVAVKVLPLEVPEDEHGGAHGEAHAKVAPEAALEGGVTAP